jgi:DNA-binding CsgD family transcriptional regulator
MLAPDDTVVGKNGSADQWLDELHWQESGELPVEIRALVARLRRAHTSTHHSPLTVRAKSGRWVSLEASWISVENRKVVAVIVQDASPEEMAPIVMTLFGLSGQERIVSGLVFQGESTQAISRRLRIAEHTVQDHLKAIFDKTGVRSRRELVATVFRQQYLPRMKAGDQPSSSGYFADQNSSPR